MTSCIQENFLREWRCSVRLEFGNLSHILLCKKLLHEVIEGEIDNVENDINCSNDEYDRRIDSLYEYLYQVDADTRDIQNEIKYRKGEYVPPPSVSLIQARHA